MTATRDEYWQGRAAVVTGAARGQGAALAMKLLADGATVHAVDHSPEDRWDPAWDRWEGPGTLHRVRMNVSQEEEWHALYGRIVDARVPLAALVNNAGITGERRTVVDADPAEWNRVLAVNLTGAFLGIRSLAPVMQDGGAILNVSSTTGLTGYHAAAYTASKWGLRGLTKSAALALASRSIRVNTICPGVVDTEMVRSNAALYEALRSIIPMSRMASADELAEMMKMLISPVSSYVTGEDIVVDGGVMGAGLYLGIGRTIGAI